MNVTVMTVTGEDFMFEDCTLDYDTTVIQISDGNTTTFPLANVLWFTFNDGAKS